MKSFLLGTVALAAFSTCAFAADLPSRRAPPVYIPPPLPIFSWTGFYIGGQAGYEFGHDRSTLFNSAGGQLGPFNVGETAAAIGGGHVGYNYALTGFGGGGLVVGVEADVDGTNNSSNALGGFENHSDHVEGSARGRIGIAVDRALFYATGGAAFAQFDDSYFFGALNRTTTRVGWTAGGGVEYAITPNWSLRAEYRYSDFGTYNYVLFALPRGGVISASNRPIEERVQVGFSYKFDSPVLAPVVARY